MDTLSILNERYPLRFDKLEQLRDGGSTSYALFSGDDKYFLRVIKPAFFDTAVKGVDIQEFLHSKGFPVPPVVHAVNSLPYFTMDGELFVLYEFIEGSESTPEQDAEAIGELIGKLHVVMKDYPGELVKRDKQFYIGRYIDILEKRQYPKTDEFLAYGEALWDNVKDLPRGYCHGDMYDGNVHKTPDGKLYLLDFDTSCEGFPMYDPALICNKTQYFDFDERGYGKSKEVLSRFLSGYSRYNALSQTEADAFFDLIALYHFALQATIIEMYGLDCVDHAFLDKQLDWLYRWREQCERRRPMTNAVTGWERENRTHFDEIVVNYDRIRWDYPAALYADIMEHSGAKSKKALEIGAGTGIATAPFLDAGYEVTAVEMGANMAAFIREKYKKYSNFDVIVSAFEDAALEDNAFDLVYAASAFHWVDAEIGCPKVYRLLKSGGTFALFRNNAVPEEGGALYEDIQAVYGKHYHSHYKPAPRPVRISDMTYEDFLAPAELYRGFRFESMERYGFENVTMKLYRASQTYSADEYIALMDTYSDHRALPDDSRAALYAGVKEAILRHGGLYKLNFIYQLYMGRKP